MLEDDMVVIGHSLGGMVALEMLSRSDARSRALVLMESVPTVVDTGIGRIGPRIARPFLKYLPRPLLLRMSGAGQSPAAAEEARFWLSQMSRDSLIDVFDAARGFDGRRHLAQIRVPTLVVVGSENKATHRGAELMATTIEGAKFETIPGGHLLHIDNPVQLKKSIAAFVSHCTDARGRP